MQDSQTPNSANGTHQPPGIGVDDVLFTLFRHKQLILAGFILGILGVGNCPRGLQAAVGFGSQVECAVYQRSNADRPGRSGCDRATFLAGMAGAGLADVIDVRVMLVFSSLILVAVGIAAAVTPGIGQPAAEWRRGLAALRARPVHTTATARPATVSDFDRLAGRLATFSLVGDTQRAAFIGDAHVRDVAEGEKVVSKGDQATVAYFILEGEAAAGIPDEDGTYRGLSTMGAGDFFGEIAALTGSAGPRTSSSPSPTTLMEVPAETLRAAMKNTEVDELLTLHGHRAAAADQPARPASAGVDGPLGAARAPSARRPKVEALQKARRPGLILRAHRATIGAQWTATRRLLSDGHLAAPMPRLW